MRWCCVALSVVLAPCLSLTVAAQNQAWVRQFGSSAADAGAGASADGLGGAYACGRTMGSAGGAYAGETDAWIAHFDDVGARTWIHQIGTSGSEDAFAVAADVSSGVYVVGWTTGSLGGPAAGMKDAWIARYDPSGAQLWIRQLGTNSDDTAAGAASDGAGGLYVVGSTAGSLGGTNVGAPYTLDGWIARYDSNGNQLWIRQVAVSSSGEQFVTAAPDGAGGVFAAGHAQGDNWLVRYDASGTQTWSRAFGTVPFEVVDSVAPDGSGGVYLCGITQNLYAPGTTWTDAWLARYDSSGNSLWVRPLITNSDESAAAVALDASGGVYVGGYTNGALGGANLGIEDAWLARYDGFGNQTWIQQFGTSANDRIYAATPAGSSGVFVVGRTNGNIGAAPAGGFDAWIAGYDLPCGARFDYCTAGTTSGGCVPSISATGTPSVSANSGFTISIAGVDGVKQGLVFYGVDNTGFAPVPWGAGWLCIKPPLQRSPAQNSGGTLGQCDGSVVLDWNAFRAANPNALGSPFTAGQHVYAQGWFRDPPSAKTTSLSGALKFNLCP